MENSLIKMTERFELLPDDAQKAISRFDYDTVLRSLQLKYKLHIDQAASLEKNVADIIFGDKKSSDLILHLAQDMHIDANLSKTIAFDVNDSILRPIQDLMKKIQTEEN
jgi:hypothetical protein